MKKQCVLLVLVVGLLLGTGINAMAEYTISWFNVGSRDYEDNTSRNQMSLEVVDENGAWPTTNIFESVKLFGPNGAEIPIDIDFWITPNMSYDNYYDGWQGRWYFGGFFDQPYSDHGATLPEKMPPGTYTLWAKDIYGQIYEAQDDYSGKKRLPIVPASSIKTRYDKKGNLLVKWAGINPVFPYVINPGMETSVRVCIGGNNLWFQVHVPSHMDTALIPKDVIQDIKSKGSGHYLRIQYRDRNNCNRTYSGKVNLP